jgi:hypothetical protein
MTFFIGRREFITLLGAAAATWPRGVLAQATSLTESESRRRFLLGIDY